jgi:hypothetical protein
LVAGLAGCTNLAPTLFDDEEQYLAAIAVIAALLATASSAIAGGLIFIARVLNLGAVADRIAHDAIGLSGVAYVILES